MRYNWYARIPFFVVIAAIVAFLLGFVVMALWNALIPVLFHGPVITFWQAFGLFILGKILFHGCGFGCRHGHGWYGRYPGYWKHRFEEKMAKMTPEEREKFKEEWNRRCSPGHWHHHDHNCCEPGEKEEENKQ